MRSSLTGRLFGFLLVLLVIVWLIRRLIELITPLLPVLAVAVVIGLGVAIVIRRNRRW